MEAIKARHKDVLKLSTDVAVTLEQALELSKRLYSIQEQLCNWLDKVEAELLSYETQALKGEAASQAHRRQKVCLIYALCVYSFFDSSGPLRNKTAFALCCY